ncbi:MAG TPA: transglutaminase domain-containing protein [Armatimonadota bacterium]|jgi:transglutaminase-like putative cysteine protease
MCPLDITVPPADDRITPAFRSVRDLAQRRSAELFGVFETDITPEERAALEFLYAGMPLCDLADRNGPFFLEAIRATLAARRSVAWGPSLPEDVFRHFALPLRVNTENLDTFRTRLWPELVARVAGMFMREAALEINHWCHEKAVYQSTDGRTSAPLATMKTAFGRCGEESTLAVSALRAVCIPARQVYTPRWAHCDDNHAWVEVWIDGEWRYLGACEPEPDLDLGWFREPARRAMLVHTKAYGPYTGDEPVVRSTDQFAELNLTAHYAPVRTLSALVTDAEGRPVPGASVDFRLFNMAEFFSIATRETDACGRASLETGRGDLLLWARKGNACGFRRGPGDAAGEIPIPLDFDPAQEFVLELDQAPPPEPPPLPPPTADAAACAHRMEEAEAGRAAYIAGFMDEPAARALAEETGLDAGRVWSLIGKSRGNWSEIAAFLRGVEPPARRWALPLLESLSEKDLRDTPAAVLDDHLVHALENAAGLEAADPEAFAACVLCPRVANEMLGAYRGYLRDRLAGEGISAPRELAAWVRREIRIDDAANYARAPLTPRGVYDLRVSDAHSRDIFFVAACRSLGTPARLDPATRAPQFMSDGRWVSADLGGAGSTTGAATAGLTLYGARRPAAAFGEDEPRESGGEPPHSIEPPSDPVYGTHFTLARFTEGQYVTLGYKEGMPLSRFPERLELPHGHFCAVTGSRQPDGTVLARLAFFTVQAGEHRQVPIVVRYPEAGVKPLGALDPNAVVRQGGRCEPLSAIAAPKGAVLCWAAPGQEPTRHLMEDIRYHREALERWGGAVRFLLPPGADATLLGADFEGLPAQTVTGADDDGAALAAASAALGRTIGASLPAILVVDARCAIRLVSEGYRIGIGEQIVRALAQMK